MELFNEIRNKYFMNVIMLINQMTADPHKIYTKIEFENSFKKCFKGDSSSNIDFPKKYINDILNENLKIFDKNNGKIKLNNELYKLKSPPAIPYAISAIEKWWLINMLKDKRCKLFIKDELIDKLITSLNDNKTINDQKNYIIVKGYNLRYTDNLDDENFIKNFRLIYQALKDKQAISYKNLGSPQKSKTYISLPYRIEYSIIEKKFRVSLYSINKDKTKNRPIKANISSLRDLKVRPLPNTNCSYDLDYELKKLKNSEVTIKITDKDEKNTIERAFILFSSYDKSAFYDEKNQSYELTLHFYKFDKDDIINKILSLGANAKIINNDELKKQVIFRLRKQLSL